MLDASGNSISSIEHLAESGLTELNTLKLHSNDIESLDALDNAPFMTTLTHLDLNHNEIDSLTPLGGYAALEFLDVASNKVNLKQYHPHSHTSFAFLIARAYHLKFRLACDHF